MERPRSLSASTRPPAQCNIFEDNQKNLENVVETLSGYLEREQFAMSGVAEFRQQVLDKSKYCAQRCKVLLEHVKADGAVWIYHGTEMASIMAKLS